MDQIHEKELIQKAAELVRGLGRKLVMTPENNPEAAAAENQADIARNKKRDRNNPNNKVQTGPRGL